MGKPLLVKIYVEKPLLVKFYEMGKSPLMKFYEMGKPLLMKIYVVKLGESKDVGRCRGTPFEVSPIEGRGLVGARLGETTKGNGDLI